MKRVKVLTESELRIFIRKMLRENMDAGLYPAVTPEELGELPEDELPEDELPEDYEDEVMHVGLYPAIQPTASDRSVGIYPAVRKI